MRVEHAEIEGICKGMMKLTADLSDYENDMPPTDFVYLKDGAQRILDILDILSKNEAIDN